MQTNPTYFIEVIKKPCGTVDYSSHYRIQNLEWSITVNKKHAIETIAIFKVYPKPKPIIAHYDNEVKSIIVQ